MFGLVVGVMIFGPPEGAASPAAAPYVRLELADLAVGQNAPPLAVQLDRDDLAVALGVERLDVDRMGVAAEVGAELVPLPWQIDAGPDGSLSLSVLAPPGAGGVRVMANAREAWPPADPQSPLSTEWTGGALVVRNDHYAVVHSPAALGGLPSRIEFLETGKVFEGFAFNDRLHDPSLGGFLIRNDASPTVEAVAAGPICATVRVRAAYTGHADPPGAAPTAEYTFRYFAGSPLISVNVHAEQREPFAWSEFHFLELNYPDEAFTHWATPASPEGTPLQADESTRVGSKWAAVTDGTNVLGLLWKGDVRVYDGRGGYGAYLHGPWAPWDSRSISHRAHLYIGAPESGPSALAEASAALARRGGARIGSSLADALSAAIAERGSASGGWADSLARRPLDEGRPGAAVERLRAVRLALEDGRDPIPAALDGENASYHRLGEGRMRALLRMSGSEVTLESLYDNRARRELASGAQPLWKALFEAADGSREAVDGASGFLRCSAEGDDSRLLLTWSEPRNGALAGARVQQELTVSGPRLASRLRVRSGDGAGLWTVTPLTISLCELGGAGADDWGLIPLVSGQCSPNPCQAGLTFQGDYPSGWCSLQFGALYDPDGGLYFGCQDPEAWHKSVVVKAEAGRFAAEMEWRPENMGVPGNGFEQPGETVLELFDGDWYDAARIHRAWAAASAPWWPEADRPDTPQWMKDTAIWAQTGGGPEECVDRVKRMAEYMGVPVALHWYNWHQIPFDVEYPHYFPTKPGMAEGVRELQEAGVRVMPYINGRLWDTALEDFAASGRAAATKDRSGEPYIEEYGSGAKLAPMCPTQRLWSDTVRGLVLRLCGEEVGVDGVYIDQIAAAGPRECFDASHGHPVGGGNWWTVTGYWPLLTQLREELRALSPEKMITTECNAEPYANLFDGYLTWHFQYRDQVPLTAAIYGGRIQLFGRAYSGDDAQSFRCKGAQSLVWGEQLGWMDPSVIDHPDNGPYFRRLARMRYALREFLATGEMEHPPTLDGEVPDVTSDWRWSGEWPVTVSAVQTGAWRAADGRVAVLFANTLLEPLTVTWNVGMEPYFSPGASTVVTEDGADPGPDLTGIETLDVDLGPGEVRAYILTPPGGQGP